jgi:hypothetical protein
VVSTTDLKSPPYQKITITSSLVNYPSVASATITFDLYLVNPCLLTKLIPPEIQDMSIQVGSPPYTQLFRQA